MTGGDGTWPADRPAFEPLEARLLLSGSAPDVAPMQAGDQSAVYLLITSEALSEAFQPLVDRRTSQGMTGKLVTVEWIDANCDGTRPDGGSDLQTKVRNCIITHYQRHGTRFVALGGDETVIPPRYCATGHSSQTLTELYYADTDGGTWDANADGVYGEVSSGDVDMPAFIPDVHLGRIPVYTPQQAADYCCKVETYESASPDGFANSMLITSSKGLIFGDDRPEGFRDHDPICDGEAARTGFYRREIQPYWQATPLHSLYRTYTSWDENVCGDYAATAGHLVEQLSQGYHHVAYMGHGTPHEWVMEGGSRLDDVDVLRMTNATRLSIVWSGGCGAAGFDHGTSTLSEAFIRNPNGGAVVFFGYAETAYSGALQLQLYREVFQNGLRCVGEAFTAAKTAMAGTDAYHQYIYSLLGDPAITILGEQGGRSLQIASPAGCEVIDTAADMTVRWNAAGAGFSPGEKVKLEYSDDSGATWYPVPGAEQLDYDGCAFDWQGHSLPAGSRYRVRVTSLADPAVSAASRTDFTVHALGVMTVDSAPVRGIGVWTAVEPPYTINTRFTRSVKTGDTVTLIAPALADHSFTAWKTGSGDFLSNLMRYSFTFDGDTSLVAEYELPGEPREYYVNDETPEKAFAAGDDTNDGLTPQTPMRNVQSVLDRYADIEAIHVSEGTYTENIQIDAGDAGLVLRGAGADVTIIDGDRGGRCLLLDNVGAAAISGFTFRNGLADWGGGIRCNGCSPTIRDCVITGNQSTRGGAGMYNDPASSPYVEDCAFIDNDGNSAGGAYNAGGSATFINCRFEGNTVDHNGGAMGNVGDARTLVSGCVFLGNSAPSSSTGQGGAIVNSGTSAAVITMSVFYGNTARRGGAAICAKESSWPVVTSCLFVGNDSRTSGGALRALEDSALLVTNCTFVGNQAGYDGGGAYVEGNAAVAMANCISWGNVAPDGPELAAGPGGALAVAYCDVEGGQGAAFVDPAGTLDWAEGNFDAEPLFVRDPDDGGDGWGVGGNDDYGDLHITAGSPCLNAGDPGGDYAGWTDIDGQPRVAYGRADVGADEYVMCGDADFSGRVDFRDYLAWKANAGAPGAARYEDGDFDLDGDVDRDDFRELQASFGCSFSPPTPAPPEGSEACGDDAPAGAAPPGEQTVGEVGDEPGLLTAACALSVAAEVSRPAGIAPGAVVHVPIRWASLEAAGADGRPADRGGPLRTVGDLMAPETSARPLIGLDEDVLRICLLPDLRAINWLPGTSEPGGRRA